MQSLQAQVLQAIFRADGKRKTKLGFEMYVMSYTKEVLNFCYQTLIARSFEKYMPTTK